MKRILWLLNHKTLMTFEVPLLRKLGYEVYIPKKPPFDVSIAVDWESDKLLSIPQDDLHKLNAFDFYEDAVTIEVADIINKYFDIAMFIHTPTTIASMVDRFHGVLVLRAYGRPESHGSYSDVILGTLGLAYMNKIQQLGKRFIFGESYNGISKIECEFFKTHTLYMPIGMANAVVKDCWTGEKNKGLYICPRIKTSRYYLEIYKAFKKNFKGIPFDIGGVQPISVVSDPDVLGYLPQAEYDQMYPAHSFLMYVEQEPNFITYPPLEAVRCGLPLLFLANGMLDKLGGEKLPGRCLSIQEARKKSHRLLSGDASFAKRIQQSQSVLLEKFTMGYCIPYWKKAMQRVELYEDYVPVPLFGRKKKRLGVVLPVEYTGGVLDYTIRIIKAIQLGAKDAGDKLDIIFAYLNHLKFEERDYFKPIRDMGIQVRSFEWKVFSYDNTLDMLELMGISGRVVAPGQYCMISDGMAYMNDCDALLLAADRIPLPLLTMQPYGIIAHDYIQRLNPDILGKNVIESSFLQAVRCAKAVFTSTPVTMGHAIQYAGVPHSKIHLIPVPFTINKGSFDERTTEKNIKTIAPYFLWSTNAAPHKNHKLALRGLSNYYAYGGNLDCVITGVNTLLLDPGCKEVSQVPYITEIRQMIKADSNLRRHLKFKGELPKSLYMMTLQNAAFLLHPGTADNGNGTAFDAAYLGVPTVSADYAAMRYYDQYFPLNMRFFDAYDQDNLTKTLLEVSDDIDALRSKVVPQEKLQSKMIDNPAIYREIYHVFKEHLAFF